MSRVSVAVAGITYTAGTMLIPGIFGVMFLSEPLTSLGVLSLLMMLTAIIIPYYKNSGRKLTFNDIIICGIYFINCGIQIIITKLYAISDGVCDSSSFYCMTNIVIAVVSFIITIIFCVAKRESFLNIMRIFNFRQHANILSRNVLADIGAIITLIIFSTMEVSVYTVIISSLSLICSSAVSRFYFKEKFSKSNLLSVFLAVFALILCV